uniref:zona pellucida protein C n=1 Tax=Doryrhamphus excisus TaxID=161450 RepID=UPI0025AE322B|nr:zona pellucida protein C [Doryrhamphus excisus]
MEVLKLLLCVLVSHLFWIHSTEAVFSQHVPGFFQNILPSPFKISNNFNPFDTIFSSLRAPEFDVFAELSSMMEVPDVQVYCDESELILLVDKRMGDVTLKREEIQLGDGCYSNSELPNQMMFTYSFDQCGTSHEIRNGLDVLSNALHFSRREPVLNKKLTPSTVHVSCIPNGLKDPNLPTSAVRPDYGRRFSIRAMTSSWTRPMESSVYTRGDIINMEVSAKISPHQRLFIQSCFASSSPEPHTKPRYAFVMNKGCTALLASSYPAVKFIDSQYSDVVKFALNTTYLISEMYIHCTVIISNQEITSGSKSCNFDLVNSRWEELSGNVDVCNCCSSKCKGLSVKHLPQDAKAVVTTGPFYIVEMNQRLEPEWNSMQSDSAAPEKINSESQWSSPSQSVVVVKQDPIGSLTLVLPAQMEDTEHGDYAASLNELQSSSQKQETNPSNVKGQSANWPSHRPLLPERTKDWNHHNHTVKRHKRTNHVLPIIHSKIQLSKSPDGSHTLSYEEEVAAQDGGETKRPAEAESKWRPRRKGLSIFLDLLRRMNDVE